MVLKCSGQSCFLHVTEQMASCLSLENNSTVFHASFPTHPHKDLSPYHYTQVILYHPSYASSSGVSCAMGCASLVLSFNTVFCPILGTKFWNLQISFDLGNKCYTNISSLINLSIINIQIKHKDTKFA